MGRWLVRIVVTLSVALSVAVALLWVRSQYVTDHAYGTRGGRYVQVTSARGSLRWFAVDEYTVPVEARLVRAGLADEEDGTGRWVTGHKRMYVVESERSALGPVRVAGGKMWADLPLNRPGIRKGAVVSGAGTPTGSMSEEGLRAETRPSAGTLFPASGRLSLAPPPRAEDGDKTGSLGEFLGAAGGSITLTPPLKPPEPDKPFVVSGGTLTFTGGRRAAYATRAFPAFWSRQVVVPYWLVLVVAAMPTMGFGLLAARRARVRRSRRARGLCVACGYDLRGSSGSCPECGAGRVEAPRPATT